MYICLRGVIILNHIDVSMYLHTASKEGIPEPNKYRNEKEDEDDLEKEVIVKRIPWISWQILWREGFPLLSSFVLPNVRMSVEASDFLEHCIRYNCKKETVLLWHLSISNKENMCPRHENPWKEKKTTVFFQTTAPRHPRIEHGEVPQFRMNEWMPRRTMHLSHRWLPDCGNKKSDDFSKVAPGNKWLDWIFVKSYSATLLIAARDHL